MRTEANAEEDRAAFVDIPAPRSAWRVVAVETLPSFRLRVRFRDETEGIADLNALINGADAGVFAALRDEALFSQVRVERGVVAWPIGLDLAPDAMHAGIKNEGIWVPR